jgi:U4/U6 small nuclear ribonucleoprotein PRP4
LFGEGPADRRERLRNLLATIGEDTLKKRKQSELEEKKKRAEVINFIVELSTLSMSYC